VNGYLSRLKAGGAALRVEHPTSVVKSARGSPHTLCAWKKKLDPSHFLHSEAV
jgi:hypothetical protein